MSSVIRHRAPHKVHVLSWALALERDGSVSCHFKDCQYMALSIQEMANHYPLCSADNSKFPYVCDTCSRRTDAIEKLLLHRQYSHSYNPTVEEVRLIKKFQGKPVKNEVTPLIKRYWGVFLEKKKYLKCLSRQCLYVTNTIQDMERHYLNLCKASFWAQLVFECEFCNGRVTNDYDLKNHINAAHESKTYLKTNNTSSGDDLNSVEIWSNDIQIYKQAKCFTEGCRFVDNNVKILQKHFATCNGNKKNLVVCTACGSWLKNESRLNEHKRCLHKDLDDNDYINSSFDHERDPENEKSKHFDDMSPVENETVFGKKKLKTEEPSLEVKIPIWYLQPNPAIKEEVSVDSEDPLGVVPSTSNDSRILNTSLEDCNTGSEQMPKIVLSSSLSSKRETSNKILNVVSKHIQSKPYTTKKIQIVKK